MPENLNPEHQLEYLKELRKKYEVVLADAQKTGDYSEAEKLKEELNERLTALEALFPKPEAKAINPEIESKEVTETRAREIMGEDFYSYAEIYKAFGPDLSVPIGTGRPAIHYSEKDLLEAKKNGEMLILRSGIDHDGQPVTIKRINEIVQPRMAGDEEVLLKNAKSPNHEYTYTNEAIKTKWVLVRKAYVPFSTNINYASQTKVLRDSLRRFGVLTEQEFKECSDERLNEIFELMHTNIELATSQLAELLVNKNHRRSAVEVLYDNVLLYKNKKDISLGYSLGLMEWTNTITKDGAGFVALDNLRIDGAYLANFDPLYCNASLCVTSVR